MSRQSSTSAAVFYLLCLLSLLSLAAAQNTTSPASSNSTLPGASNSTADPLADDPSSAANTISSKAALFGALIAAALFAI